MILWRAVWVAGEVINSVAEVEIVHILPVSAECLIFLPETDPLGLGRCVRCQFEHVQHTAELIARHGTVVGLVEVVEERKQLYLRVFHLQSTAHRGHPLPTLNTEFNKHARK